MKNHFGDYSSPEARGTILLSFEPRENFPNTKRCTYTTSDSPNNTTNSSADTWTYYRTQSSTSACACPSSTNTCSIGCRILGKLLTRDLSPAEFYSIRYSCTYKNHAADNVVLLILKDFSYYLSFFMSSLLRYL